ncbi:hypothetical protein J4216_02825 [Candidatus Woesearchaeota archaeon]|nr:hypothetical protein [Candidatus Woesearchaeota archaeon]
MKILKGQEEKNAMNYIMITRELAKQSKCKDHKCGSIIVKDNKIIGQGFNSPPKNLESQRRCDISKENYDKKVTDKTCCIHAEQRAILDALINNPDKLKNSRLYFTRIDKNNELISSGKPYCTICSKMTLDVGISEFILSHENGVYIYNTEEYNDLSFNFKSS